jgi:hypothetical protein
MIQGASYAYYICSVLLGSVLCVFSGLGCYGKGCPVSFVFF